VELIAQAIVNRQNVLRAYAGHTSTMKSFFGG
jgi:hypothetical protein